MVPLQCPICNDTCTVSKSVNDILTFIGVVLLFLMQLFNFFEKRNWKFRTRPDRSYKKELLTRVTDLHEQQGTRKSCEHIEPNVEHPSIDGE